MLNAAKLLAKINQGQGLINSFLVAAPNALCPASDKFENVKRQLGTESKDLRNQVLNYIKECQQNEQDAYEFNNKAKHFLKRKKDAFFAEVNAANQDGSVTPPKSKHMDLAHVVAALHVFTTTFHLYNVSAGHDENAIPTVIN